MINKIDVEKIVVYMEQNNFNKTTFCKKCNLSVQTFNKILKGEKGYRITALFKIARELGCSIADLLK